MKKRDSLIRYRQWQVDEQRRKLADLYAVAEDLDVQAKNLELTLANEQEKAKRASHLSFAYPGFAEQAIKRRENLKRTRDEINIQIETAKSELSEMYQELKKIEILDQRQEEREKAEMRKVEDQQLDELAGDRHRRSAVRPS